MQLSKHFTLEEMEKSQTATRKGIKNKICLNKTTGKISNITKLCDKNEKELVISNESSK